MSGARWKNHNNSNSNNNNNKDRGKIFALNYICVWVCFSFFCSVVVVRVRTIDFIILYQNNIYCSLASLHAQSWYAPTHARSSIREQRKSDVLKMVAQQCKLKTLCCSDRYKGMSVCVLWYNRFIRSWLNWKVQV